MVAVSSNGLKQYLGKAVKSKQWDLFRYLGAINRLLIKFDHYYSMMLYNFIIFII